MHRELNGLALVARQAAETAGAAIRAMGPPKRVQHKGAVDLVTEVDLRAEAEVRRVLEAATPGIAILAEEGGGAWDASSRWIVDPLDGTTNFVHGYPAYAVSIGLELEGQLVVGVVHDAHHDRTYWAARGLGAWSQDTPLRVSEVDALGGALLVTGFPYDRRERAADYLRFVEAFLTRAQCIRRGGAASLDFCLLADGRLDGYWELGLKPWDVAAGIVIVEEAGGRVTDMGGGPLDLRAPRLLATNGRIHPEMLGVLEPLLW